MKKEAPHNKQVEERIYQWIEEYQQYGDDEAQLRLVEHYEPLVKSLARKFARGGYEEDINQVGMVGLLAAIERYDDSYGRNFESFAIPTIIGEIKRYIRDKTWSVHVPRRIKELGPKIKNSVEVLTRELQRSPQINEIAEYLDVSEENILETMEMSKSYQALSVDRPFDADQEGGEVTLLELVGKEDSGYEKANDRLLLEEAFEVLSERERLILTYTYFENLSQKETGNRLGISQMHVSRLQRKALEKIRESFLMKGEEIFK